MIIFIGGLIGVGKTTLAMGVADKLGYYYYDVDAVKKEVYKEDPDFAYNLQNSIPFSDETRSKLFNRVAEELVELASSYQNIVVDETLHKQKYRDQLLAIAKKHYDEYLLVFVTSDEDLIQQRLESKEREGHMLKDAFGMYVSFKKQFEPFSHEHIVFNNAASPEDEIARLTEVIKSESKLEK